MRQLAEHRCSKCVFTCPVPILFTSYFQMYLFINIPIHLYISVCCLKVGRILIVLKKTNKTKNKIPKTNQKAHTTWVGEIK